VEHCSYCLELYNIHVFAGEFFITISRDGSRSSGSNSTYRSNIVGGSCSGTIVNFAVLLIYVGCRREKDNWYPYDNDQRPSRYPDHVHL